MVAPLNSVLWHKCEFKIGFFMKMIDHCALQNPAAEKDICEMCLKGQSYMIILVKSQIPMSSQNKTKSLFFKIGFSLTGLKIYSWFEKG